jgi:hypothetical protein
MTGPKCPSRTNDIEAWLESISSRPMASLTIAADPAIGSERWVGHEHDAYPEGIVLISILAAVLVSFSCLHRYGQHLYGDAGYHGPAQRAHRRRLVHKRLSADQRRLYDPNRQDFYLPVHPMVLPGLPPDVRDRLSLERRRYVVRHVYCGARHCRRSAGLFTGMMTIVANVLPLHKRPAILRAIMGLGQLGIAGGPLISGALTSNIHATWRWCFYLNLSLFPVITLAFLINTIPEAEMKSHWQSALATAAKSLDFVGFDLISRTCLRLSRASSMAGTSSNGKALPSLV